LESIPCPLLPERTFVGFERTCIFIGYAFFVGFFGKLSFGYLKLRLHRKCKSPSIPGRLAVELKTIGIPLKIIQILPFFFWTIDPCIAVSRKISSIAFHPECPNGGFPISCANEAAATIAPNHSYENRALLLNGIFLNYFLSNQSSKERPTTETSKLCVSLCTKSVLDSGITCVYLVNF
jgi:hypothetical protein